MLITKNHGFKRRYAYGGSGIFDSLTKFISNLISSNASKQLAATTLDVGRKTAVEVGKAAAIDVGKKLVEKGIKKVLTPKSQQILSKYTKQAMEQSDLLNGAEKVASLQTHPNPQTLTHKAQSILSKYINTGAQNINSLIDGSGCSNAIAIQDLVRKLNGSGVKVA